MMPLRLLVLLFLLLNTTVSRAQAFRSKVHLTGLYDNILINTIPSYIEIHGLNSPIHTRGIYNTSKPKMSIELGYALERTWGIKKKIYSGVSLGYRRVDLSYVDKNLYYLRVANGEITEVFFIANVERNFLMLQIPLGVSFSIVKGLHFDLSFRNHFVLDVSSKENLNDKSFDYRLATIERRMHNKYLLEMSAGFMYQWPLYAIGLKYIQGLTPLYPDTNNAYNEIIPSKIYFSSVAVTVEINLRNLFGQNNK